MHDARAGRRPEDNLLWKLSKDFWPIIFAIVSLVSMYSRLESRLESVEKISYERGPILLDHGTRITRVETMLLGWDKRMDAMENKLDRIYAKVK